MIFDKMNLEIGKIYHTNININTIKKEKRIFGARGLNPGRLSASLPPLMTELRRLLLQNFGAQNLDMA